MGNRMSLQSSKLMITNVFKKAKKPFPIETSFKLPSPIPSFPPGEGFATGIIDIGGLLISEVSTFTKVWSTLEDGPGNLGATFFEPASIPDGFFMLGCYCQPNNKPLSGYVLTAKDISDNADALKPPVDYNLVWSSESLKIKQDGIGYLWLPIAPEGYKSIGLVITTSSDKPDLDKIRCVRSDFTDDNETEGLIWGSNGVNVYGSRPRNRGVEALSIPTGAFSVQVNGVSGDLLPCLKVINGGNKNAAMPNVDQLKALIEAYSPVVYFHPDEEYFPASVEWLFRNGALLYEKGKESSPIGIDATGSNLPQNGTNDGMYWIDLPVDNASKERVKKGDLSEATAYLHVKPMLGGAFTDIAIWLFYPFNGPARAKVEFFNVPLGKIGEHVGDWEHVTLRISNFNGELKRVYLAQHSKGIWVDAPDLGFETGNKPRVYSSLHGHASYPKQGLVLQGNGNVGIRNDSGKGKSVDAGSKFSVVSAEYLGPAVFSEPPWLNFARKWGPQITYDTEDEIRRVEKALPGKLKGAFDKLVRGLPNEVFGEDGPTGPKGKSSWAGDEPS